MFNHPEGQPHPRPPSHLKKSKRYDFGEDIFGKSSKAVEEILKKGNQLELVVGSEKKDIIVYSFSDTVN